VPVRTPRSVTRMLPCHIAESHNFSPPLRPQSPFPRLSEVWHVLGARVARWRVLRVRLEYALPLTFTKTKRQSTVGTCVRFCFRVPVGTGAFPVGPTPSPRSRLAQRWLDRAALGGGPRQLSNRPIADGIQSRRQRPEPLRVRLSASASAECGGRDPARLPCRDTPLHLAASKGRSDNIAELLMRGADGAIQNIIG
jgi:hypothetical protein